MHKLTSYKTSTFLQDRTWKESFFPSYNESLERLHLKNLLNFQNIIVKNNNLS